MPAKRKSSKDFGTKAKDTAVLAKLDELASSITVRFQKSDDHRLSASIAIAEAKALCEANKIPWRPWATKNIKQSFEQVRKLLPIGEAENKKEGKGAKMLSDLRKNTAARVAKSKAKKLTEAKSSGASNTYNEIKQITDNVASDEMVALDILTNIEDTKAVTIITEAGKKLGLSVGPVSDGKVEAPNKGLGSPLSKAQDAFLTLKASDKLKFAEFVAKTVGVTIDWPKGMAPVASEEDLLDIPKSMRRTKSRRAKKATA